MGFLNYFNYLPVTERRNEVETAVDSVIDDISSVQPAFVTQESLVLFIDVF